MSNGCESGWRSDQADGCFQTFCAPLETWHAAKKQCQLRDAELIRIDNKKMNKMVINAS